MAKFQPLPNDLDLDPAEIFRPKQAEKYLGYKHSQLAEKVRRGEIAPPIPLSAGGNAVGWTGRQLIEHHRRRLQLAAAKHKAFAE
jgi:predicted DNA-binding transcriptional regulator AlpA